MEILKVTPTLRIFDEAKAREFYVDFLGFTVDFEHRFAEDTPLFMQVSLGPMVLHLSEHHGDASPGSTVSVRVQGVEEYHAALLAKRYKYNRPSLDVTQWNSRCMQVHDPFGNRIRFDESL